MISSLGDVARIATRYQPWEKIYLRRLSRSQINLERCLTYLLQAYCEFGRTRIQRFVRVLLPTSMMDRDKLMTKIKDAEDEVQKVFLLVQNEGQSDRMCLTITDVTIDFRFQFRHGKNATSSTDHSSVDNTGSRNTQRRRLLSWLKAINTTSSCYNALKNCVPETGLWIFNCETTYGSWIEHEKNAAKILWVHGNPGYGKTVLFARILEKLYSDQVGSQNHIASFFCSSSDEGRKKTSAILCAWISQIIQTSDKALKVAYQVYLTTVSQHPAESELWKVLRLVLTMVTCTLAVDGFDECSTDSSVFSYGTRNAKSQFLERLCQCIHKTNTKVLITSRPHDDIKMVLQKFTGAAGVFIYYQPMGQQETSQDLELCAKKIISTKFANRSEEEQGEIAMQVAKKSEGMFLYLNLLCQGLQSAQSAHTIRQVVSEMPSGLDFVYERELERIMELKGSRREEALATLRWALFAMRPLTVRELAEALALTSDIAKVRYPFDALPHNWSEQFVDEAYVDTLIANVGSLVELRKNEKDNTQTIHLIHGSLREYLLQPAEGKGLNLGLLDRFSENDHLARLCLQYLCYGIFNSDHETAEFKARIRRFPFIFCATVSWCYHARSRKSLPKDLEPEIEKLFNLDTKNWLLWSDIFEGILTYTVAENTEDSDQSSESNIDYSTDTDAERVLDKWNDPGYSDSEDDGEDEEEKEEEEDLANESTMTIRSSPKSPSQIRFIKSEQALRPSALYYAALLGLTNLVRILQVDGLDCNASGGPFGFPLQAAIEGGFIETVAALLENPNINVNQYGGEYGSAVAAAAAKRLDGVLAQLVRMGASTNTKDRKGNNPLHYACLAGGEEVARFLVEHDSQLVTLPNNAGETPICFAVKSGKLELVTLLYKHGADLNSKDEAGIPILSIATSYSYHDIVLYLVRHRVDIEAIDVKGHTCIFYAIAWAEPKIVRLLISHKANIFVTSKNKDSVMHAAYRSSGEASDVIAKLVLNGGAPLELPNLDGVRPIHLAVIYNLNTLQLILEAGADINALTLDSRTPLMIAIRFKVPIAAKLLIERGADPNILGLFGDTAFKLLLDDEHENEALIRLLLSKGNVHALQTERSQDTRIENNEHAVTPLDVFEAIIEGDYHFLLKHIDEGLAQGSISQAQLDSALLVSVAFRSLSLAEELLERGARADCRNLHMQSPLHLAVMHKDSELMLDLLQRYEVPVGARDTMGRTAIQTAVRSGMNRLTVVEKLLPAGSIFDQFEHPDALQVSEALINKVKGHYKGVYKFWTWNLDRVMLTSFTIDFFETRSPDKWQLPWFRYVGEDTPGPFMMYGYLCGNGEMRFLKMYKKYGWYYEASVDIGTDDDGENETVTIRGRWGESHQKWHGTFEFTKVI